MAWNIASLFIAIYLIFRDAICNKDEVFLMEYQINARSE